MTKHELLNLLKGAVNFEEKAAPLLQERSLECLEAVKASEMIENDKIKMRRLLFQLVSGARDHQLKLETLIKKVEGSENDEF